MKVNRLNTNDVALIVLSKYKKMKGDAVDLSTLKTKASALVDNTPWTNLLSQYVDETGAVDYRSITNDQSDLNQYLESLSRTPPGENWNTEQKLAYWINAYNAFTVKLIIDNYPLKSIKDISSGLPMINSPWDMKFFEIGRVKMDLNTIEHEILRKQFDEPRIHFAINCASISCPNLRNEAFVANRLEQQLEEQTLEFINDPSKNYISKNESRISKIFTWFAADFNKKGSVDAWLRKYHDAYDSNNKLEYLDYDWGLNGE